MATDADLLMLFDNIDKDKSQTISLSELKRSFAKKGLSESEIKVCHIKLFELFSSSYDAIASINQSINHWLTFTVSHPTIIKHCYNYNINYLTNFK